MTPATPRPHQPVAQIPRVVPLPQEALVEPVEQAVPVVPVVLLVPVALVALVPLVPLVAQEALVSELTYK